MSKTKKMMVGISSTALMLGMTGCSTEENAIPDPPEDSSCAEWEWDTDDGVWECEDGSSSHYGHYFYGGRYYKGKSALYASKDYAAYKSSSSFKGGTSSGGSGFGKGSTSSGG